MLAPLGGVSEVRVTLPLRALRSDSATYTQIQDEADLTPHLADAPRLAVLHRPLLLGEPGLARLRTLLRQGMWWSASSTTIRCSCVSAASISRPC